MPISYIFKPAVLALIFISTFMIGCATGPQDTLAGQNRDAAAKIIAVGDIHGDYDAYTAILRSADLIDDAGDWSGGKTVFVQTGDIADRGAQTRKIITHMRKLETQAEAAGGRVVPLIGNHEAMVMTGDLRYVAPGDFAAFAPAAGGSIDSRAEAGLDGFKRAWSPGGDIGKWIIGNDAIAMIDGNIFIHGGISREYANRSIAGMNKDVRAALKAQDEFEDSIINDPLGPLWYRGLIGFSESAGPRKHKLSAGQEVDYVLKAYGAKRIIVGHTPTVSGIKYSDSAKLIRIDTGASSYYGGTQSFLRIENGAVFAHDNGKVRRID